MEGAKMSNSMMNPISRIVAETASSVSQPAQTARPIGRSSPAEQKPAVSQAKPFASTRLQFRMDEKTNEVTIMIVDKASDKVIRTIPPKPSKTCLPENCCSIHGKPDSREKMQITIQKALKKGD